MEFDPYYRWLSIPPNEQPPHHYRLLGIEVFESDKEVISLAADRQRLFLRQVSVGGPSELANELITEVSAARLCLLNLKKKAHYDDGLRHRLSLPTPPPVVVPVPAAHCFVCNGAFELSRLYDMDSNTICRDCYEKQHATSESEGDPQFAENDISWSPPTAPTVSSYRRRNAAAKGQRAKKAALINLGLTAIVLVGGGLFYAYRSNWLAATTPTDSSSADWEMQNRTLILAMISDAATLENENRIADARKKYDELAQLVKDREVGDAGLLHQINAALARRRTLEALAGNNQRIGEVTKSEIDKPGNPPQKADDSTPVETTTGGVNSPRSSNIVSASGSATDPPSIEDSGQPTSGSLVDTAAATAQSAASTVTQTAPIPVEPVTPADYFAAARIQLVAGNYRAALSKADAGIHTITTSPKSKPVLDRDYFRLFDLGAVAAIRSGDNGKAHAYAIRAFESPSPSPSQSRSIILNLATTEILLKGFNVHAVTLLNGFCNEHATDEEAMNLLGCAIDRAAQSAINASQLAPNINNYLNNLKPKLEASRQEQRRWGNAWLSQTDYDDVMLRRNSAVAVVKSRQYDLDQANTVLLARQQDFESARADLLNNHRDRVLAGLNSYGQAVERAQAAVDNASAAVKEAQSNLPLPSWAAPLNGFVPAEH